jgi:hypothetical protein
MKAASGGFAVPIPFTAPSGLPIFFGALASTQRDFLPLSLTFAHRAFISSAILFLVAAENRRRDLGAAD